LSAGQQMMGVVLTMIPTGVISGRIVDGDNIPLARVHVQAAKASYALGQRVLLDPVSEAETNDLGEYRLFGLAPGFYFVSATPYRPSYVQSDRYLTPTPPCPDCRGEGTATRSLATVLSSGGFIDPIRNTIRVR